MTLWYRFQPRRKEDRVAETPSLNIIGRQDDGQRLGIKYSLLKRSKCLGYGTGRSFHEPLELGIRQYRRAAWWREFYSNSLRSQLPSS